MHNHNGYVVILHGILRSSWHMRKLAAYLTAQNYKVFNLNYPSTHYPIDILAQNVWQDICGRISGHQPIHFVGYSLGGLVTRALLHQYYLENLGRVVLIGTPNKGSEIADFLQNTCLYKSFFGASGQQLITNQDKFRHLLGDISYDCGGIAGSKCWNPIAHLMIKGESDGTVSIDSTKLDNMKAHTIIHTSHINLPYHKQVHRQVTYFLKQGCFLKNNASFTLFH